MHSSIENKKIVCLGSGMGTMNLISGLRQLLKSAENITVVATTTDDGGSGGRIRRLFNTLPPGDIINSIAGLVSEDEPVLSKLLRFRFPGDRYGADSEIGGQKLGNLMLVAAHEITGDYDSAVELLQKLVGADGKIYPATSEIVTLSAVTKDGVLVQSEENIDLGKYQGKPELERIFITPENPSVSKKALQAIDTADIIIVGPGDLYTTILPVLIIPAIQKAFLSAKADKVFIVNVANKPQETEGYTVTEFISSVEKHVGEFPFQYVLANKNTSIPISVEHTNYTYVGVPDDLLKNTARFTVTTADLVDENYSIYHDPLKLAAAIMSLFSKAR